MCGDEQVVQYNEENHKMKAKPPGFYTVVSHLVSLNEGCMDTVKAASKHPVQK